MLKHYIVEDLTVLPQLEAWVAVREHRCRLFTQTEGEGVSYRIVVEDPLGMTACSPQFEAEFGDRVRLSAFPR